MLGPAGADGWEEGSSVWVTHLGSGRNCVPRPTVWEGRGWSGRWTLALSHWGLRSLGLMEPQFPLGEDEGQECAPWTAEGLGEPGGGHGVRRPASRGLGPPGKEGFARIPTQALGSLHNPLGTRPPGSRLDRIRFYSVWPPGPAQACPAHQGGPSLPAGCWQERPGSPTHPNLSVGILAPRPRLGNSSARRELNRKSRGGAGATLGVRDRPARPRGRS